MPLGRTELALSNTTNPSVKTGIPLTQGRAIRVHVAGLPRHQDFPSSEVHTHLIGAWTCHPSAAGVKAATAMSGAEKLELTIPFAATGDQTQPSCQQRHVKGWVGSSAHGTGNEGVETAAADMSKLDGRLSGCAFRRHGHLTDVNIQRSREEAFRGF